MAVVLKVWVLVALLSCIVTRSLRQKVTLTLSAQQDGHSQKVTQQYARLDKALATEPNRGFARSMSKTAAGDGRVLRFDVYDDQLVLSGGGKMLSNFIYTYAVFSTQEAMEAWTPLGTFEGNEMMLPAGMDTMTQDDGRNTSPWFFWARVQSSDFAATKAAFAKLVAPTRAEAGTVRYDNACTVSGTADAFCFENLWYNDDMLIDAQNFHNMAPHMKTFSDEVSNIVIEWGMARLQLNQPVINQGGSISYIKVLGGSPENADLLAKLAKVPECNYQGLLPSSDPNSDTYKVVDMKCCDLATWTGAGLVEGDDKEVTNTDWSKKKDGAGDVYTCPVGDLGALGPFNTYIRGYQGCESNKVVYAESCVPADLHGENSWPMTKAVADTYWEQGTHESCHCEEPKLIGDQCFVGKSFPTMAFFGKSIGDVSCGGVASNLPTAPPPDDSAFGPGLGGVVMIAIFVFLSGLSPGA